MAPHRLNEVQAATSVGSFLNISLLFVSNCFDYLWLTGEWADS